MSNEFMREDRYFVFKISDVVEHLTTTEALHLARLYEIQRVGRREAGKAELECVVVESDWPEYESTWRAIEARVTGAQPAPGAPWVSLTERMPNPDKHDRVLIYTEGYDFGGEQIQELLHVGNPSAEECRLIRIGWDAALARMRTQGAPDGWLRAIDEALVVAHLGVAEAEDGYEEARRKLNELICWHVTVATDPAVNGGFKLMPVEPTKEIYECFAAYDGTAYSNPFDFDDFKEDYASAIAAAQETKP